MADTGVMAERAVEINDPSLSADLNHRLTTAVRDVIGRDSVLVPADRPFVSRGEKARVSFYQDIGALKASTIGSVAVAIGVGMVILTTGNSWWLTAVAVVVLLVTLANVTLTIIGLASTTEYPDPFIVAQMEEQGVRDPENRFTALVREFTPPTRDDEHRTVAVEDDPARAIAEQEDSITAGGGPSTAVGPGD